MAKNLYYLLLSFLILTTSFSTAESIDNDKLWDSETLSVSAIYPNPAVSSITIDYRLFDSNAKASIIIRSVIGSEMGVFHLNNTESSLTMALDNFSAGIYFYTLQIDGQEMVTKKFMVTK